MPAVQPTPGSPLAPAAGTGAPAGVDPTTAQPGQPVAGQPVAVSQDLQRMMFADAIGRPLSITVMRNGALVDVIAEPTELVNA